MAFAESPTGDIFIGTEGTGLNVWNRRTGQIHPYKLKEAKANTASIIALGVSGKMLLVGTYQRGFYSVDMTTGASKYYFLPYSPTDTRDLPVNCIKTDSQGKIWLEQMEMGSIYLTLFNSLLLRQRKTLDYNPPKNPFKWFYYCY
jgi:ligand-binding sensor domain-containing protein